MSTRQFRIFRSATVLPDESNGLAARRIDRAKLIAQSIPGNDGRRALDDPALALKTRYSPRLRR
jgi:hypothetical protein